MQRFGVGPFLLDEQIGKGGMGEVWRGRHAHQDVDVAVKVVTSERAQKPYAIRAFRDEVHAMARLTHPGVVLVYDTGEVTEDEHRAAGGRVPAGSPWVAMELARLGTLDRVVEGLHWHRLRAILLSILDALAHAHARGLVHRDLKPGNVLLTADSLGMPRLKLADFGLAQAIHEIERGGMRDAKISGTPRFMAPEQVEGKWREQGPWTDLYALGCVTYWLVAGAPPYSGTLETILRGHLFEELPPLSPNFEVPRGFIDWTRRLLNKRPRDRWQRAADAAWALLELDPASIDREIDLFGGTGLAEITEEEWSSVDFTATIAGDTAATPESALSGYSATIVDLTAAFDLAGGSVAHPGSGQVFDADLPPIPAEWRRREDSVTTVSGIGAGLGLYGLRPVPMTGRDDERSAIWDALREVWSTGDSRALLLRGPAGIGKSRLAQWGMERAHEVGAAETLVARHAAGGGAADGLAQMLRRNLRVRGLDRSDTLSRVRDVYFSATGELDSRDVYDCMAITEMLVPSPEGAAQIRFKRPSERWVVLHRYLSRVAKRPSYIWIDDAQWGPEALDFVAYSLKAVDAPTALFVLTIREEAVDAEAAGKLIELAGREDVRVVEIDRLPESNHRGLVTELLHLDGELAREVADRTDGNPLFAVQLVGDWVQRGILELSPDGFRLAEGASAKIPDDIHAVWNDRVERLVAAFPPAQHRAVRVALETAAALGQEVDDREWRAAVRAAGESLTPLLLPRLIERGLADRDESSWRFHHGLLRESLIERMKRQDRSQIVHRACATMLNELYSNRVDILERRSQHRLAAGDLELALGPLEEAASMRTNGGDFEVARRNIETHAATLEELGEAESSPRWGTNWGMAARCFLKMNLVESAREYIERGTRAAREHDWTELTGEFALHRANWSRKTGDADEAETEYRQALDIFHALGDPRGTGRAAYGVAEVLRFKGQLAESITLYEEALDRLKTSYPEGVAITLQGLAGALIASGEAERARAVLEDAVAEAQMYGQRSVMAAVSNMLGELERREGNLAEARQSYRRAVTILQSIGSRGAVLPRLNIALIDLAEGEWSSALPTLEDGVVILEEIGEKSHLGLLHVCLGVAAAGLSDWESWDEHFDRAEELLKTSRAVDPEIVDHAKMAADLADERGERERASRARSLASDQEQAL